MDEQRRGLRAGKLRCVDRRLEHSFDALGYQHQLGGHPCHQQQFCSIFPASWFVTVAKPVRSIEPRSVNQCQFMAASCLLIFPQGLTPLTGANSKRRNGHTSGVEAGFGGMEAVKYGHDWGYESKARVRCLRNLCRRHPAPPRPGGLALTSNQCSPAALAHRRRRKPGLCCPLARGRH